MCVKEFYGYNCGHCSVPYLRQCPLSQSNKMFPICKYPAERPIFTDEYCHPCSRVLWNIKVLKEEDEHRGRHQRGECGCEVIFDAEERERRLRPRSGKGKGKGREGARGEYEGPAGGESSRAGGAYGRGGGGHGRAGEGYDRSGRQYSRGVGEYGQGGDDGRGTGGGMTSGRQVESSSGMGPPQMMEHGASSSSTRKSWAPDAKLAAYDYVGYVVGQDGQGHIDLEQGFSAAGGYVQQRSSVWNGQLMMGDVGSGMKWYPQDVMPPLPALPPLPPPLARTTYLTQPATQNASQHSSQYTTHRSTPHTSIRAPTVWQKAMSEPANRYEYQSSLVEDDVGLEEVEDLDIPPQPIVVSSDMGKEGSS